MAARNRTGQRAAKTLEGTKIKRAVHVSACLKREKGKPKMAGQDTVDYYRHVSKLYVDAFGNLVAQCSCGDEAFVANPDEIKDFAEFLTMLVAGTENVK